MADSFTNEPVTERTLHVISSSASLYSSVSSSLTTPVAARLLLPREVVALSMEEKESLVRQSYALLTDWMHGGASVLLALRDVAQRHAVPIFMLCGTYRLALQVTSLTLGADGVLFRPFNSALFEARLLAFNRYTSPRRAGTAPSSPPSPGIPEHVEDHTLCTIGPLTLDHTSRTFYVRGHTVALTLKEFELLTLLMEHPDHCCSRDMLLEEIWDVDFDTETNVIDVHIFKLRKKLEKHEITDVIKTVRGIGYRLCSQTVEKHASRRQWE